MITLDEIFRRYGPAYLDQFSGAMLGSHKRAIEAICSCLTPELGGHVYQCEDCGAEHVILHSCRNRACPRCQTQARNAWLDARAKEILPVRYFHAIFTVPHELAMIFIAGGSWLSLSPNGSYSHGSGRCCFSRCPSAPPWWRALLSVLGFFGPSSLFGCSGCFACAFLFQAGFCREPGRTCVIPWSRQGVPL